MASDPQAIREQIAESDIVTAEQFDGDLARARSSGSDDDLQRTLALWQKVADRMARPDIPAGGATAEQLRERLGISQAEARRIHGRVVARLATGEPPAGTISAEEYFRRRDM